MENLLLKNSWASFKVISQKYSFSGPLSYLFELGWLKETHVETYFNLDIMIYILFLEVTAGKIKRLSTLVLR